VRLNGLPQFRATIDGVAIHFIHVRSPRPGALPLVITHGWPGSVIEYLKVIAPLTDPASRGGDPADAFDVVLPSLPGYGFSGQPARPGWGVEKIAAAWAELMARLGYRRYGAVGSGRPGGGRSGVSRTSATGVNRPGAAISLPLSSRNYS
jgi:pimeloyl-ACP methyl ester carboxylesterase